MNISSFLIKCFIKNSENIQDENIRMKYGLLSGITGIILNFILFILKFISGTLTSSISIIADAFNNLSDMTSSIITILGFKLSNMPPNKKFPYGYARFEFISALFVAIMVLFVGFDFIKTSIMRIINPMPVTFESFALISLLISIVIKIWIGVFNRKIANKINSPAIKATSVDALGDAIISSCVVISFIIGKFTSFPIDAYMGVVVSIFILYSGYNLIKDAINPLLGEAPDREIVSKLIKKVASYENVFGVHDLVIHNYGVGKNFATIHVEMISDIDVIEMHETIDKIERDILKEMNINLVIHLDPVIINCDETRNAKIFIQKVLAKYPNIKSMHDFRIVGKGDRKNLIFDIIVDFSDKNLTEKELISNIKKDVKKEYPLYDCIIIIDRDFI